MNDQDDISEQPTHSFTIRPENCREVMRLYQAAEESGKESVSNLLWIYLEELFPGSKEWRCRLNTDCPWEPVLELIEPNIYPKIGTDGVTMVVQVTGSHFDRMMTFVDMGRGPLYLYLMWEYLVSAYPVIKSAKRWEYLGFPRDAYIYTRESLKPLMEDRLSR